MPFTDIVISNAMFLLFLTDILIISPCFSPSCEAFSLLLFFIRLFQLQEKRPKIYIHASSRRISLITLNAENNGQWWWESNFLSLFFSLPSTYIHTQTLYRPEWNCRRRKNWRKRKRKREEPIDCSWVSEQVFLTAFVPTAVSSVLWSTLFQLSIGGFTTSPPHHKYH